MNPKQKIYQVVKAIEYAAAISPKKAKSFLLDPKCEHLKGIGKAELKQILKKLESDEKVIVVNWPDPFAVAIDFYSDPDEKNSISMSLTRRFPSYCAKLEKESYEGDLSVRQRSKSPDGTASLGKKLNHTVAEAKPFLWITYTSKREILINDVFCLSKPDFESENDKVFDYLMKHPDKMISMSELEKEATREKIRKTLHDIARDLGFRKDLASVFFDVSKNSIKLHNPISKALAAERGFNTIRIAVK